ncbi:hypothetical protein HGM15179_017217 [Zosterops borbonicus]|uniref:Ig-like domain-containing protein n=1 Tax=Zosterops borbonicus TaxID=364589 RepID=A0A8K1G178_9PASS|nr:hypothetical protein HGM15179_017217 [Zosterops borbonicus]
MWELLLLLLPPGLGAALGTPGPCQPCRSGRGGHAVTNATLGATVTLGCPTGGAALGRLVTARWHLGGVPVCSRGRGPQRCHPPFGDRAALGPPGALELRDLRGGDGGTFTCVLLGERECACGSVTLRLRPGVPCSPPCSGAPPRGGRGGVTIVTVIVTVIATTVLLLPPARGH